MDRLGLNIEKIKGVRQKLNKQLSLLDLLKEVADTGQKVADELETSLPMLWWAGVRTGRLSLHRFVEVTATNPAKLLGLYPTKGTIAPGSDADLVIWDGDRSRVIDGSTGRSRAGWSPYDGWEVTGWPALVLSRGEVVARDGQLTDAARPGRGRLVGRGPTQAL